MKIYGVGMDEKYWKGKSFEKFEKFWKGDLRSDYIKPAFDEINKKDEKIPDPKKVGSPKDIKPKEVEVNK